MCGITGFVNLDGRAAEGELLTSMNEAIRHRGPDEDGYYLKGRAGGHGEAPLRALGR